MSDYQPKPGDEALVTIRLHLGTHEVWEAGPGGRDTVGIYINADHPAIVSVVPAPIELPTMPHAVIRAELGTDRGVPVCTLHHTPTTDGTHPWLDVAYGTRYRANEITRVVEVLFDGWES